MGDFVAYAEGVAGRSLEGLFDTWLYQPVKPGATAADEVGVAAAGITR